MDLSVPAMEALFIRDENIVGDDMKQLIGSLHDDQTVTALKAEVEYLHEAEGDEIENTCIGRACRTGIELCLLADSLRSFAKGNTPPATVIRP